MFLKNYFINIKIIINLILLFYIFTSKYNNSKNNSKNIYLKENLIKKRLQLSKEFNNIYSILYDAARFGDLNYNFTNDINLQTINYQINKKNGVCACVIGKNENLYAKEFVEYYRLTSLNNIMLIGFDKIYIFDNNEINKGDFEEILNYLLTLFLFVIL